MPQILGPFAFIALPLLGFALLWAVHLIYARRTGNSEPMQLVLTTAAWLLIMVGVLVPIGGSMLGLAICAAALLIAAMVVFRYRLAERRSLLWVLAVSAQHGLPLGVAARAFAQERTDEIGRRAARLAELLDDGVPLPDALQGSRNRLPLDAEIALRLEGEAGQLGAGLIESGQQSIRQEPIWRQLFEKTLYLIVLTCFVLLVVNFLFIKAVPSLVKLYEDFAVELPAITKVVIAAGKLAFPLFLLGPWILMFFLAVAGAVASFYYIGWVRGEPPGVRWLTRPYHRAVLLQALARPVAQGRPLQQALQLLAQYHPQGYIRARLSYAQHAIAGGAHWCDAMRQFGLLRASDVAVLKAAERVGNLAWAMRELAERSLRRMSDRMRVFNSVGVPVIILLYIVPIAFIMISLFVPLVSLTINLSQ